MANCPSSGIVATCGVVSNYLTTLSTWFAQRNLRISPQKSKAMLVTTWTKEFKTILPIHIAGVAIPTVNCLKVLGVTLDTMYTFSGHVAETKSKVQSRNNLLRRLAGSTWGAERETLLATYKATGRPVLNYGAPIWTPKLSPANWKKLQAAQNSAIRISTGCTATTSTAHLHHEAEMLEVEAHNRLLASQFHLGAHLQSRPDHQTTVPSLAKSRKLIPTLASEFGHKVRPLLPQQGHLTRPAYKAGLAKLHKQAVADAVRGYYPPVLLNGYPPPPKPPPKPAWKKEKELPRRTRTQLAQLRSGYSPLLASYRARLDPAANPACPDCGAPSQSSQHLFKCPQKPTELQPVCLWRRPAAAARFLGLDA
jgi:hypothetical protein